LSWVISGCIGTHGIQSQGNALPLDSVAVDEAIARAAGDAGWPSSQWWRVYADPQLDHLIELALQGSPSLAMAAARVRKAKALAGLAESAEALQVQGTASLMRHEWPTDQFYGPGALADTRTWDNNAALGLSYALDFWDQERNATERALDMAHASAAQQRQAQLELQENIVRAYIQLALNYARRDIVEATLAQQTQLSELAERRLKGGLGTHLEVSQAQSLLPETHRQIDALDEAIALGRNQLAALAGKGPGEAVATQRPVLSLQTQVSLPSALPAQLLGQRPDVVASRWEVAAQARGIEVAHAGFYPDIDLSGSLGYMATGGGMLEFLTGRKLTYKVGPAISLPIFDGGRLRAELGQAAAGYDLAVAQYNQTLVMALKNVSDQLIRRESMDKQQQFAAQSVASAQKTYDIAMIAYRRGLTDYLNVLNAQTLLFRQQQVQQQVEAARLTVYAGLVVALGGGLAAGDDTPAPEQMQAPKTPALLDR
jgi:NodT family efflux transporter outer membrane factor (OMF) lipoprotein